MDAMIKKYSRKISYYLPLFGMLAATVIGFSLFAYDKNFQLVLGIAAAAGYTSWGIVYHHIRKDLNLIIVMEYVAMSFFGVVTLFFLLFRV